MRTQNELRAFASGVMAGAALVFVICVVASVVAGVKWQPVPHTYGRFEP